MGEARVADQLRSRLSKEYHVINDIYLPLRDGSTVQIDHVVVSRYGIFVVETKAYSGWIFGGGGSKEWTQILYGTKKRFQNPLRQNYKHKCALADCLGLSRNMFKDVVVFTGDCTFKTKIPPEVVCRREVSRYIMGFRAPVLSENRVGDIVGSIVRMMDEVSDEQKKLHVRNLRRNHSSVSASAEMSALWQDHGYEDEPQDRGEILRLFFLSVLQGYAKDCIEFWFKWSSLASGREVVVYYRQLEETKGDVK